MRFCLRPEARRWMTVMEKHIKLVTEDANEEVEDFLHNYLPRATECPMPVHSVTKDSLWIINTHERL